MSAQGNVIGMVLHKYGEPVTVFRNIGDWGRNTKGIVSPFYYNDKPYKELTESQKNTLRLAVSADVLIWTGSIVEYRGRLYNVKNVSYIYDKGQTIYKWAMLSPES